METEIKFKIQNKKEIVLLLLRMGAKRCRKEREVDYLFDFPKDLLMRRGGILRLRKTVSGTLLTFKGPLLSSRFKKRDEINVNVGDFIKMKNVLERIGFVGVFSKEKIREKFTCNNLEIFLDKLPFIGYYLEIEGKPCDIVGFIQKTGLPMKEAIKESYNELFHSFCMVNQRKIKKNKKKIEFSFESQKWFNET